MRPALIGLLLLVLLTSCQLSSPTISRVTINDQVVRVETANDPADQAQGLSGRTSLPPDRGLLFRYAEPAVRSFWMKDMNFALDLIWIRDNEVIGITANVPTPTSTNLLTYPSPEPVDAVLEVNAGWVDQAGVTVGDKVQFNQD